MSAVNLQVTQGKCVHCKIRWVWEGMPRLKGTVCPECGRPIERTVYRIGYRTVNLHTREQLAPARGADLTGAFKSVCLCGHTGDGRGGQHAGEIGHGRCMMALCSCAKFTWARYIESPKAAA